MMTIQSYATSFKGCWYSSFVSPSKNIHHFNLELVEPDNGKMTPAKMTLVADRSSTDRRLLVVNYRVHVEIHGPFLAALAKDDKPEPDGLNVMILELIRDEELRGTFTWNSLTSGTINSANMSWTRRPSAAHEAAYQKARIPASS